MFVFLARRAAGGGGRPGPAVRPHPGQARRGGVDADDLRGRRRHRRGRGRAQGDRRLPARRPRSTGPSERRSRAASCSPGAPGTGKTLLARAMAGEAEVPFFSASAAEFIEMIVGVGASRVRDLFEEAKKAAPAIIFIDELDAIGRARGGNQGLGGHDEREQTLNQILTEMDGFDPSIGVIVLAATNRPEVLDSALLRPGRFDRRGHRAGARTRTAVARSSRSTPARSRSAPTSTSTRSRRRRPAWSGADLANLVNEAALLAARRGHPQRGQRGLRRRPGEGHPRRRAQGRDERQRARAHGLPRGRPRPGRHAHRRRRPGAEDLDHPARPGARRDAVRPRGRPLQLRRGLPALEDPRRARRARGRGGRLRRRSPRAPSPTSSSSRDRARHGRRAGG